MSHTMKPLVGKEDAQPARPKRVEGEAGSRSEQRRLPALAEIDAWVRASQIAAVGLFVIALLWCAYVSQPVLVPVLLAWAIATIVLPIVKWLGDRGVPRVLAAILVTVFLLLMIVSLFALLSTSVVYWLGLAAAM